MKRRYSNRLTQKEIVNVKANGSKLWEILYVSPLTKKRRRSGIGKYPEVTLKMAREILSEHKCQVLS